MLGELRLGVQACAGVVEVHLAALVEARVLYPAQLLEEGRAAGALGGILRRGASSRRLWRYSGRLVHLQGLVPLPC